MDHVQSQSRIDMNKGFVIWLTGLPGSGKTTIARQLLEQLKVKGVVAAHIESDHFRKILTPTPSYSRAERDWFYSVLVFIAKLLSEHGVNVLLDATANLKQHRNAMRAEAPRFLEIYIRCPLEVCVARDPKGIYAAAQMHKATNVPGMQDLYEEPEDPEMTLDSDRILPEEAAQQITTYLSSVHWIPSPGQ